MGAFMRVTDSRNIDFLIIFILTCNSCNSINSNGHMWLFVSTITKKENLIESKNRIIFLLTLSDVICLETWKWKAVLSLRRLWEERVHWSKRHFKGLFSSLRHYLPEKLQLTYALMAKIFDTGTSFVYVFSRLSE